MEGGQYGAGTQTTGTTKKIRGPLGNFSDVVERTADSITIEWGADERTLPFRKSWRIYVNEKKYADIDPTKEKATITGLKEYTEYEISVRAIGKDGTRSDPETYTAKTKDGTTPSVPSNFGIASTTDSSVTVFWDPVEDNASGLARYALYLDDNESKTVQPGTTSATIDGLSDGDVYTVAVAAVDAAGNESERASVTIDMKAPPAPSGLDAGTDDGTVSVSWDAVEDSGKGLKEYRVFVGGERDHVVGTDSTSTTIDGLSAESHEIGVAAVDAAGNVSPRSKVSVTIDPSVPAPSNLTADATGLDVSLSWDGVDVSGIEIAEYSVRINGELLETVGADTTTSTFEASSAGEYEFGVTAISTAGDESDTATVTATIEKPSATITLDLDQTQVGMGNAVSAPITLSEAPNGLSGYEITVSTGDSSVATIENATYNDALGLTEDPVFADDNSSVTLIGTDVDEKINSGATDVTLASVTVAAEAAGATSVDVAAEQIDADNGGKVAASTEGDELTVRDRVPVGDRDEIPTDPDGDGLHEDLNANGRKDFDDVVTFFKNKDEDAITDYADAYDFNGNGRIDFDDIPTLVDEF